LYEEPTARETRVFADADGHDLARCYGFFLLLFSDLIDFLFRISWFLSSLI